MWGFVFFIEVMQRFRMGAAPICSLLINNLVYIIYIMYNIKPAQILRDG